jgi:Fic family protein
MILNYRQAFLWACKYIQKSSVNKKLLCTIHQKAKRGTTLKSDLGVYRNRQNWIGPQNCKIEDAYFYPPAENEIEGLMRKLFSYARRHEKEPFLQLALIFAQILIIHPFMDGNGRVARILIPLFLYQKKIIPIPYLFMSRYFLQYRLKYFQNLFETTEENKWETWINFFLKGVINEMKKSIHLFNQIISFHHDIEMKLPMLRKGTIFFLFQNPIFSDSSFRKAKGDQYSLKQLRKLKFIKKEKGKYYFSHLLKILKSHKKH